MRRRPGARSPPVTPLRRCAVYTRVSSDHGLEQDFNSLDAQREACAAYVRSQAHEGWVPAHGRYDDGGYSGASLDRPALQALLEEVRKRQIDVIVVYKVDRLTRSLADFAKLIELLDAHGVSFISITQSFNTTTSMGRLTLNMLLSFAQFEREVTGERIRDKIAASKKKGLWVGGVVPLGYKVVDRKLVIDEAEAPIVRLIFERYCALGSMIALMRELHEREVVTRLRTLSSGRTIGGIAFTKGPLAYLLKNRMYRGEINHGQSSYRGEHPAIVDKAVFDKTQEILAHNAAARGYSQSRSQALLVGRLYDDRGHRMTPSFAVKRGVRYRYYVSRAVTEGRNDLAGLMARVPAIDVEEAVLDVLRKLTSTVDPKRWSSLLGSRTRVAAKLIEFPAAAPEYLAAPADSSGTTSAPSMLTRTPGTATTGHVSTRSRSAASYPVAIASSPATASASESRRLIEVVVERVAIRDVRSRSRSRERLLRLWEKQLSSPPGGSSPRVSAANSSRRSRAITPTHERRGQTPRSSFLPASPSPEPCSTDSSRDGFSTSPILRSGRSAPSARQLCSSHWRFSPRAWSRPSPTTACPAASASRVLPICLATGPISSRRSACKRRGRRAHALYTLRSPTALRSTARRST
jgi:site-specific DNA recombinase